MVSLRGRLLFLALVTKLEPFENEITRYGRSTTWQMDISNCVTCLPSIVNNFSNADRVSVCSLEILESSLVILILSVQHLDRGEESFGMILIFKGI